MASVPDTEMTVATTMAAAAAAMVTRPHAMPAASVTGRGGGATAPLLRAAAFSSPRVVGTTNVTGRPARPAARRSVAVRAGLTEKVTDGLEDFFPEGSVKRVQKSLEWLVQDREFVKNWERGQQVSMGVGEGKASLPPVLNGKPLRASANELRFIQIEAPFPMKTHSKKGHRFKYIGLFRGFSFYFINQYNSLLQSVFLMRQFSLVEQ